MPQIVGNHIVTDCLQVNVINFLAFCEHFSLLFGVTANQIYRLTMV